ncbi:hypothetical protein KJ940_13780, partial [Myxococcota bacterium]|nr:hypothetical protein [Myxococcota bacterium]
THKKPCSKHKAPESAPTTAPASAPVVEQPAPVAAPCPHAAKLDAKEAAPCPHAAKLDAKEAAPCPHAAKLDANKAAPCPHAEACGCQAGCKGECQPNCKGCPLCPKKAEAAAPSPVIPGVNVEHQIGLTKAYLQEARARAIGYFYEHDQRFPPSAPLTPGAPTEAFCAQGAAAPRAEIAWDHPTWQALSFKPIGPHYFAYSFESSGQGVGATFTLRATADLDCDGVPSTFEYKALVDNPNAISFGEGLRVDQPTE